MAALNTVVIGGGIGGLGLARELSLRGFPVTVLEKAPGLNPAGAGIIMNPNAMRVLEANGLADALRERAWPILTRQTFDHRGRPLAVRDYRPLYDAGKLSVGAFTHRAHLHKVLSEGLPSGAVRFGITITRMDLLPDRVCVRTDRGERFEADLLVGADGIRSAVRERFFGVNEPTYLGYRSHRFVVENVAGIEHFTEFYGRGKRIGLVPISKDALYVWTTFNSPRHSTDLALDSAQRFRERFREFTDARVRGAFAQVTSTEGIICTDIEEIHQDAWVHGRVVLLGDAAHALTPNMGQGAGMAMEDAAVLALEIAAAQAGAKGLEDALGTYVARRKPRVEAVRRLSREVGEEGQIADPIACWLRNRRLRRAAKDVRRNLEDLERLLAYPI